MKKVLLFSVVIIVLILSFKLSKNDDFKVSEDYFDTIRKITIHAIPEDILACLLYTSPSPRDLSTSRMPSSA